MVKITIDGIEFEVSDQVAQAHTKAIATLTQKVADAEKSKAEMEKEKEEADKAKDKAEAKADALEKGKPSEDAMAQLIADKAELVADAKRILGDKYDDSTKDCGTCDTKLKAAVIGSVMKDIDLTGKSEDYVAAMYDMAIKQHDKAATALDNLGSELTKDKDGKEITRDSIRKAHNKKLGLEV